MTGKFPGTTRSALAAVAALVLAAGVARAAPAAAGPLIVRGIGVEGRPEGALVTVDVATGETPRYTVFKLSEPARLVVDLPGADVSAVKSPLDVHRGGIEAIATSQFAAGDSRVGRVTLLLQGEPKYDVSAKSGAILIAFTTAAKAPAIAGAKPVESVAATPVVAVAKAEPKADKQPPQEDPNVVVRKTERLEVDGAATKLLSVTIASRGGRTSVSLKTDGAVGTYDLLELKSPGRLALDLHGVADLAKHGKGGPTANVKGVRLARHGEVTRVAIDGTSDRLDAYEVKRTADGLVVTLGAEAVAAATPQAEEKPAPKPEETVAPKPEEKVAPKPEEKVAAVAVAPKVVRSGGTLPPLAPKANPAPVATASLVKIQSVDYRAEGGLAHVLVALEKDVKYEVTRPDASAALLTLHGVQLPDELQRNLDVSALDAPIAMVSTYRDDQEAGAVHILVSLRGPAPDHVTLAKKSLRWDLGTAVVARASQTVSARAAADTATATGGASSQAPSEKKEYVGRRVDFNVKDIEIVNLLEAIADISKKNIVVGDDVKGKVTIRLRNVPWDEALDVILKLKALGKQEQGNIIRVAPLATLQAEAKSAADASQANYKLLPLHVKLVPVNYASAADLSAKVKDTLSERGTVSVDTRTNVMIVKDVDEALIRAEAVVRNLDTQTPQVLIEARIVEASTSYVRQIGIQWGGSLAASNGTGNPTGLVFPSTIVGGGAADDSAAPVAPFTNVLQNFVVNMPAPIGLNTGAGLGFLFGSAGGAANLALRLSAFENNGTIKTISAPKVTTLDNESATISQGISIPFSQVSAAGVATAFIEARLSLQVTPHVTQDGSILLKINAQNNQPNPQLTGSNGQPSISRREASTDVLVKDNDTTVIGGIYTRRNSEAFNEVPGLSKIPILGWLFKKRAIADDRTELLIFVSPRIVNRSQSTVATAPEGGSNVQ